MTEFYICDMCGNHVQEEFRGLHNELHKKPEHRHRFTVPVEWEYLWGFRETVKAVEYYKKAKRVTKLKCESCPEIEEVKQ